MFIVVDSVGNYQVFVQEKITDVLFSYFVCVKKCVSTSAAGARIRRSLGHHLLHPRF